MKAQHRKQEIQALRAKLDRISRRTAEETARRRQVAEAVRKRPAADGGDEIRYRRHLPRTGGRSVVRAHDALLGQAVILEEAVASGQVVETAQGACFEVEQPVDELEGAETLSARFKERLERGEAAWCDNLRLVRPNGTADVGQLVFMDIETAGLSSSPLFLIGAMSWDGRGFTVRQFFARNYAEEAAVIRRFVETSADREVLITFNGKSFDVPFVRTRAVATGVPYDLDPAHLDLLHESRRIWKDVLPNCKLQTLETHVCGRSRHGDIPGRDIPQAYHDYVRTNDAWQMVEALRHNMLDLVTLADIMLRLP